LVVAFQFECFKSNSRVNDGNAIEREMNLLGELRKKGIIINKGNDAKPEWGLS